jgi:hypothetical protein
VSGYTNGHAVDAELDRIADGLPFPTSKPIPPEPVAGVSPAVRPAPAPPNTERARYVTTETVAEYLTAVETFIVRYIALPSEHEAPAIALWIAHAHLVERFETSPILAVTSAELRSGKTRTLDVLELLVPSPRRMVLPSEAVTYTILAQRPRPTLLLDEADAIFGPRTAERYEGLRAILNSGNRQGTPVLRVKLEGRSRQVDEFDVFGPKAVAGIGDLPTTVADRAIPIRLRRRRPDEPVAKFRRRIAAAEAQSLILDWQAVQVAETAEVPDELPDRAADSWEPLLAIADAAGGAWPARAQQAAIALSADDAAPVTIGIRLLADISEVFGGEEHLPTVDLLARLHDLEGAPWSEWYGKPLTARGLAKLLMPYRVGPAVRRPAPGAQPVRGYYRSEFLDAWARYVPSPESVTSVTSVTDGLPVAVVTDVTVPQAQDPEYATDDDQPALTWEGLA